MITYSKVNDNLKKEIENDITIWMNYILDREFNKDFKTIERRIHDCDFQHVLYSQNKKRNCDQINKIKYNDSEKDFKPITIDDIKNVIDIDEDEIVTNDDIILLKNRLYAICQNIYQKYIDVYKDIDLLTNKVIVTISLVLYSLDSNENYMTKKSHKLNLKIEFDYENKSRTHTEFKWFDQLEDINTNKIYFNNFLKNKLDKSTDEIVKNIINKTKKNKSLLMNSTKMKKNFHIENYIISKFINELVLDDYFGKFNDGNEAIIIEYNNLVPVSDILSKLNNKLLKLNSYKVQPLNLYLKKDGTLILQLIDLFSNFNERFLYYICKVDTKEIDPLKCHLRKIAGITSNFKTKINSTKIQIKNNKVTIDLYDLIDVLPDKYSKPKKYIDYKNLTIVEK
jgi:hypothetical protein